MSSVSLRLLQDMGIAPSQRPVHLFPPPPAQLSSLTPLSHPGEERHRMDIALRLTERVESWFGTEHNHTHIVRTVEPSIRTLMN